jgi:hypothetical protein
MIRESIRHCLASLPPDTLNVGLCDGSVRFIKQTGKTTAGIALGSRAGTETISADRVR